MATKIEIINLALTYLGSNNIVSLNDHTQEAKVMSAIYEQSLRSVLSEYQWGFALKRANLVQQVLDPVWTSDNKNYYYKLPSDLISIVEVSDKNADWKLEGESILTDATSLGLLYVYYNDDNSKFSPSFVEALAARLALDSCYSLTNSSTMVDYLNKIFINKLSIAKSRASVNSGTPNKIDNYSIVNSRFGGIVR